MKLNIIKIIIGLIRSKKIYKRRMYNNKDGSFRMLCPKCYQNHSNDLVYMNSFNDMNNFIYHKCPKCNYYFVERMSNKHG